MTDQELRDRALFDRIASSYCEKDLWASSREARQHRLRQTIGGLPATSGGSLRRGGWLVANDPHPANPVIHLARAVRKRVDARYSSEQKELTGRALRGALDRAGFIDIRLRPQGLFSTPFAEVPLRPGWA